LTAITAEVLLTVEFQPLMVPSSVSKINEAGPDLPFCEMTNPVVLLAAIPVGVPVTVDAGGTVTTSGTIVPFASYTVESQVTSSATQKGPPGK